MTMTVLVGVDEHPTARDAVVLGSTLAIALGDELAVAHVYPFDPLSDSLALGAPAADPLADEADEIVASAIAGIAPDARRILAPARSVAGGLHHDAEAEHAEIIVVGSGHRGPIGRAALGTHSTRVVHGAPCAVAVAPHGLAQQGMQLRSLAVALDGSDEALDALEVARRLAATTGADVRLVAVLPPQMAQWSRYRYVPDASGYEDLARKQAERVLTVAQPGEATEVRSGEVAGALLDVSQDVDLLVMGSRSYGPARRILLGGVSDAVVRGSSCPVLVLPRSARVRQPAPAAAAAQAAL